MRLSTFFILLILTQQNNVSFPLTPSLQLEMTATLQKEREAEQARLDANLLQLLPMVNDANLISQEMDKRMAFTATLVSSVAAANMLLPEELRYRKKVCVWLCVVCGLSLAERNIDWFVCMLCF